MLLIQPLADEKLIPEGIGSVMVTPLAGELPLLAKEIAYVTVAGVEYVELDEVLLIVRTGAAVTVVEAFALAVDVLLDVAVSVLVIVDVPVVGYGLLIVTLKLSVGVPPAASVSTEERGVMFGAW